MKAYDARLERTYFNRSPQATMTQSTIVTAPRLAFMPAVLAGVAAGGRDNAFACPDYTGYCEAFARHVKPEHLVTVIVDGD